MSFYDRTRWRQPPVVEHQLEQGGRGQRCTVCLASWARGPVGGARHCPRVPLYLRKADVPVDLTTKSDAERRRDAVDPEPVAALQVAAADGVTTRVHLYRRKQAALF